MRKLLILPGSHIIVWGYRRRSTLSPATLLYNFPAPRSIVLPPLLLLLLVVLLLFRTSTEVRTPVEYGTSSIGSNARIYTYIEHVSRRAHTLSNARNGSRVPTGLIYSRNIFRSSRAAEIYTLGERKRSSQ